MSVPGVRTQLTVALVRGGTSKGVFLRRADLPPAGPARDRLVLELLGSPDPMQLDGLGGTHSSTSKVLAVGPSQRPDVDVDYLFAQAAVDAPVVDYTGNCGNLTGAVGPYAIDEGLVEAAEPVTRVRLYNENTGKVIVSHVPVRDGRASTEGDCRIAGVPGTGARILNEYRDPGGSVYEGVLPTGRPRELLRVAGLGQVVTSIVDVTNPVVFVRAEDVGLVGTELPAELNGDGAVLERLERIRASAAVRLGVVERAEQAATRSANAPKLAVVVPPQTAPIVGGDVLAPDAVDLVGRIVSVGKVHHAMTMTGVMCTAAACRLAGTIPAEVATHRSDGWVRVGHPKGITPVQVQLTDRGDDVVSVTVERTARRLMSGVVHLRPPTPDVGEDRP
jgi:2-methylaconitate cis-trans-isomerase PrpF